MLAYRFLRLLLRLAVGGFFRRIEVVGLENVPRHGPVIFCGNHPNSLLDPVLITVFCGRIVHFAAKDVLFQSRLLRVFLKIFGAVPVARRRDHPDGTLDNRAAFDTLFEVLAQGRCMGIFPEGISHNEAQLQNLKTGAARIALGLADRRPELRPQDVCIVPCGLNYFHRHRFRSSVLIQFGDPIRLTEADLADYREDERASVRQLTDDIERHLRSLTVNAEDWDTIRVLDGVRRLYQPRKLSLEERVELARRFNTHFPEVKDEPEVVALVDRVGRYLDRLAASGIADIELRRPFSPAQRARKLARHGMLLLVWLPLAAVGIVLHLPIAVLLAWAGERWAPRKDVVGTTKFLLGFLLILVLYAVLFVYVGWRWSIGAAAVLLALMPLTGFATLKVIDRVGSIKTLGASLVRAFRLRAEWEGLRAERKALSTEIVAAVDRFRPEDLELMFPRRVTFEDLR